MSLYFALDWREKKEQKGQDEIKQNTGTKGMLHFFRKREKKEH